MGSPDKGGLTVNGNSANHHIAAEPRLLAFRAQLHRRCSSYPGLVTSHIINS